ncbi:MAG: alpha/beta hydrolase [Pseudomonadota bacterium]|nr:alpha/beta hydrolase [Pseudomonadota bacterium]
MMSRRGALTGLLAMSTAACSRLAFVAVNVPAAFGSYNRQADIPFGTDPQQHLDVYIPTAASSVPRPMVVFWYGGRWETGDKSEYRFVGAALASLGYVAVLPNYRHYDQVKMPGFMDDAARAGLWAFAHAAEFGADRRRFYTMGHSAGAHIAALVSLDRRYFLANGGAGGGRTVPDIAGVIGLSGPYDFLPLTDPDLRDMFGPPARYPDSQPINFVNHDAPPMLLVHGLQDRSVAPKNSINLAAALRSRGIAATLKLYPKLTHADTAAALSIPARGRAPVLADIENFVGRVQPGADVA